MTAICRGGRPRPPVAIAWGITAGWLLVLGCGGGKSSGSPGPTPAERAATTVAGMHDSAAKLAMPMRSSHSFTVLEIQARCPRLP